MALFTSFKIEIDFGSGYVDVSTYQRPPIVITQGRKTPYDTIGPAVSSFSLWNPDGRFMPKNTSSPYGSFEPDGKGLKVRLSVAKAGVTYVRHIGRITGITPQFGETLNDAYVAVTSADDLSILSAWKQDSVFTSRAVSQAVSASTWADVFPMSGFGTSGVSVVQIENRGYPNGGTPGVATARPPSSSAGGQMSLSETRSNSPIDTEGICSISTLFGYNGPWIHILPQGTPKGIYIVYRANKQDQSIDSAIIAGSSNPGTTEPSFTEVFRMDFLFQSGSFNTRLANPSGNVFTGGGYDGGQWLLAELHCNSGNNSLSDFHINDAAGGGGSASAFSVDIRTVQSIWIGAANIDIGGIAVLGTAGQLILMPDHVSQSGGSWTLATRYSAWQAGLVSFPGAFGTAGSATTTALCNGFYSATDALTTVQTIVRSGNALVWARPSDGTIMMICSDVAYPASSPLLSINIDADCMGRPTYDASTDNYPTRVTVSSPAGTITVVSGSEPVGIQRSTTLTTFNTSVSDMNTVATSILAKVGGLRIPRVTLDLVSAATDYTSTVFGTSGSVGASLFPTQRITLAGLPSGFFSGSTTKDVWVMGWEEHFGEIDSAGNAQSCYIVMETIPAS
jgi:hypothetical protein